MSHFFFFSSFSSLSTCHSLSASLIIVCFKMSSAPLWAPGCLFFGGFFCILLVDLLPRLCVVLCCVAAAWESGEFACLYFLLLLCLVMSCLTRAHVSDPSLALSSSQSPPQLSFLFPLPSQCLLTWHAGGN